MLGLELRDAAALALVVDERGHVVARAEAAEGDLATAAVSAIDRVLSASPPTMALGIASAMPESPGVMAAVKALAPRLAGSFADDGAVGSGVAAAVAEAWVGAARGASDVVYFGVGEHATAGILRAGLPVTGAHRRAPAAGWLSLNPVEREDYRKVGCLEAEVSSAGIVRRLIWRIKAGDRSRVQELVADELHAVTIEHVLQAARERDGVSISVIRDTAKYLGMAAANLVAIADPETLVLGGVIASAADLLFEPVRTEIGRRLPPATLKTLTIVQASLGSDAPAIGAARLAAAALQ